MDATSTSANAAPLVHYEQPLNERIRRFLRLEFLFAQTRYHVGRGDAWATRDAIADLQEILEALGQGDIKSEIISELERHAGHLESLRQREGLDLQQLDALLSQIRGLIERLHEQRGQPGAMLRNNEFLIAYRQRNAIPGGTCAFDLPRMHHWLQRPAAEQQTLLQQWYGHFSTVEDAVTMILRLVRETGRRGTATAQEGAYEQSLDANHPCQMIVVTLPQDSECFPEISGSRHRITIRFLVQPDIDERPVQTREDIAFRLACCGV